MDESPDRGTFATDYVDISKLDAVTATSTSIDLTICNRGIDALLQCLPEGDLKAIFDTFYQNFDEDLDPRLFDCFIPPLVVAGQNATQPFNHDALSAINDFVFNGHNLTLLIQGSAGMGKSLLSQFMVYNLDWGNHNGMLQLPIWIYLPTLPKETLTEGQLLETFFQQRGVRKKDIGIIKNACQEKQLQLTLILDGLDEIRAPQASFFDINGWQGEVWPGIKVIITSRPAAMVALEAKGGYASLLLPATANPLQHLKELTLQPFAEEQINGYFTKYLAACHKNPDAYCLNDATTTSMASQTNGIHYWREANKYIQHINQLPGLKPLITTPFLLSITAIVLPDIVDQVNQGQLKLSDSAEISTADADQQSLTRYGLYGAFVKHWFGIQANRLWSNSTIKNALLAYMASPEGGDEVDVEDYIYQQLIACLYSYSENLARLALNLGDGKLDVVLDGEITLKPELFVSSKGQQVYFKQQKIPNTVFEYIRSCCLLRQMGGSFRFLHKSIVEYFAAHGLFLGVNAAIDAYLQGLDLKRVGEQLGLNDSLLMEEPEIIKLLSEKVNSDNQFKALLYQVIEYSKREPFVGTAAANAITILNVAGEAFNDKNFAGVHIPGANLSGALCDGADFTGADLSHVIFRNAWLANTNFSLANLQEVDFGEMPSIENQYPITALAASKDGRWVAIGNINGEVSLLDMSTSNVEELFIKPKSSHSWPFRYSKYIESATKKMEMEIEVGGTFSFSFGNNISIQSLCFSFDSNYLAIYTDGIYFYSVDLVGKKLYKQIKFIKDDHEILRNGYFLTSPMRQGELLYTGAGEYFLWSRSDCRYRVQLNDFEGVFYETGLGVAKKFAFDSTRTRLLVLSLKNYQSPVEDSDDEVSYELGVWDISEGLGNKKMVSEKIDWFAYPVLMAASPEMKLIALYHEEKIKLEDDKTETKYYVYILNQALTLLNKLDLNAKITALSFDASGRFLTGTVHTDQYFAVRFWSLESGKPLNDLIYHTEWYDKLADEMSQWLKLDRLIAFRYKDRDYLLYACENKLNFWATDSLAFHNEQKILVRPHGIEEKFPSDFFRKTSVKVEFVGENPSNQGFNLTLNYRGNEKKIPGTFYNTWIFRENLRLDGYTIFNNHSINNGLAAVGFGKFMPTKDHDFLKYTTSLNPLIKPALHLGVLFISDNDGEKIGLKTGVKRTSDRNVRIWSLSDLTLLHTLHSSREMLYLSFSPNNQYLVGCDTNQKLKLWDFTGHTVNRIWELQLSKMLVKGVVVNDEGLVVVFDELYNLYFWDINQQAPDPILLLKNLWVTILNLKFTSDSQQLICRVEEARDMSSTFISNIFAALDNIMLSALGTEGESMQNLLIFSTQKIKNSFKISLANADIPLPLQAKQMVLDNPLNLSRHNQLLLQQRDAMVTDTAMVEHKTPATMISSHLAFKKPVISCQSQSIIKPRLPVNYANWTISILRDKASSNPDHTFLVIEGMNGFGCQYFWRFDLANRYQGQAVEAGFAKIIIKEEKNISTDRAHSIVQNNILNPYGEEDRGIKTIAGFCWPIKRQQALKLINLIQSQEPELVPYHLFGEQSFLSSGRHNCYTWARAQLLTLNSEVIKQQLPDNRRDYFLIVPRIELSLSPQQPTYTHARNCPMQ